MLLPLCKAATIDEISQLLSASPHLVTERGGERLGPVALAVFFGRVDLLELLTHYDVLPELLELADAAISDSRRIETAEGHPRCQTSGETAAMVRLHFFRWAITVCHHVALIEAVVSYAALFAYEDLFCWLTTNETISERYNTQYKIEAIGNSAVINAVDRGRISCLKWLIDFGCDINAVDPQTKSNPLLMAIFKGNLRIVQLLVEKGADMRVTLEDRDVNAIQAASTCGHDNIAHWLFTRAVENGSIVDVDCHDLLVSCAYLRTSSNFFAKAIVKQFPRLKDIGYRTLADSKSPSRLNRDGTFLATPRDTVLDAAFKTDNAGLVCSLLTDPAFLGISMRTHLTPSTLHHCLVAGHTSAVSLIVEYGEDADADIYSEFLDEDGKLSPENISRLYVWTLVVDCFSALYSDCSREEVLQHALREAITYGSMRLVRWLLEEAGLPVETDWIEGSPPLTALTHSRSDILDYLIEQHGVSLTDPRVKDRGDGSVLHLAAAKCQDHRMAKMLFRKLPQEVEACNSEGDTILMVAAKKYNTKVLERLAAMGAQLDPDGATSSSRPTQASRYTPLRDSFEYNPYEHDALMTADREEHFLDLVKRLHEVFGKVVFKLEHVPLAIRASLWRATEFMIQTIFPEYALSGPEHVHDQENLERIHALFLRAADREYPPLMSMLSHRFCLPEHVPKGLFYEHRYSWVSTLEEWETLFYSGLVGVYLHRIPDESEAAPRNIGPGPEECNGTCSTPDLPPVTIDPVLDACRTCDLKMLKAYVNYGATLQRRSRSGATPLLIACSGWADHMPIVKWLISKGCSLDDTDYAGKGVLDYSQPNGEIRCFLQSLLSPPTDTQPTTVVQ